MKQFKSIGELRASLHEKFEATFFSRATVNFHGDKSRTWDSKNQLLVVTATNKSQVYYEPMLRDDGTYTLVIKGRS